MDSYQPVVVITGAASGLGFELSTCYAKKGYNIVMADIDTTRLCDAVELLSAQYEADILGVICDVTKRDKVELLVRQCMDHFKRIDILINNAGVSGHFAPIWDLTTEHIRHVMDVNVHGIIHGIQAFMPIMAKQTHRAQIVNMASVYGLCSGSQMAAYAMSKHAVVALSESLHFDVRRLDMPVDVSVICPSFADTPLLVNSAPQADDRFHAMMQSLLAHSRPAAEVAEHIVADIAKRSFYILPDREVKAYCQQWVDALVMQEEPHQHSLEKIISSLWRREQRSELLE